jgi:hypothetical protein
MALGFLKRVFGGGQAESATATSPASAAAPPAAEPDARAAVDAARIAARAIRRDHQPGEWAEARQLLANALVLFAAEQPDDAAPSTYEEAESVLAEAIEVVGPDAHPAFLASMINLQGYAAYRRGEHLQGAAKRRAFTDAAERFTRALAKITPDTHRDLWVELGFYRGAVSQSLAMLAEGAEAAARLDDAAVSFREVAARGMADGSVHPIAAYNLHVVLQNRADLTRGRAAFPYLTESRQALVQAMESPTFGAHRADHEARIAALDAAIDAAQR